MSRKILSPEEAQAMVDELLALRRSPAYASMVALETIARELTAIREILETAFTAPADDGPPSELLEEALQGLDPAEPELTEDIVDRSTIRREEHPGLV